MKNIEFTLVVMEFKELSLELRLYWWKEMFAFFNRSCVKPKVLKSLEDFLSQTSSTDETIVHECQQLVEKECFEIKCDYLRWLNKEFLFNEIGTQAFLRESLEDREVFFSHLQG